MDKINIILPKDLKKAFKVKTTLEDKDMTEVLLSFIKSYVGPNRRRKAA